MDMATPYITRRGRRGFTLVEMLIVATLISLFAGLAVFSMTTQLEQNKRKAAVAECRQIGTAMAFAQQDLSFFPRICLLKYNYTNLFNILSSFSLDSTFVENHGYNVGGLQQRLRTNWKGIYMSNNANAVKDMNFPGHPGLDPASGRTLPWPVDPWGIPYVSYLLRQDPVTGRVGFLQNSGQDANFFAGIVSYGRNGVPGMGENFVDNPAANYAGFPEYGRRRALRLFTGDRAPYSTLPATAYNDVGNAPATADARYTNRYVEPFLNTSPTPGTDPDGPRIQELGSDDRFFQF